MKISIITLTTSLVLIPISYLNSANAADCIKACVDVYTQNGELVFEARKGSGPTSAKAPSKAPLKPRVVKPKPVAKPVAKPRVLVKPAPIKKEAPKKIAKKPIKQALPKVVVATSLSDRISKALPTGGITYQPSYKPLINTPVYFWNDLPSIFRTQVNLIGETIDVLLRPTYIWSFGDGTFLTTTDPGGPYPNGKVTHTYSKPGIYPVLLTTTWNGSYTHNAIERAITGEIQKVSALTITVVAAPSRFMN